MQMFLFLSAKYLGYFLVLIIFSLISIVKAKKKSAWVYYIIGAVLQLPALLGNQKTADFYGYDMSMDWLVYFGLLIVFATIVAIRRGAIHPNDYSEKVEHTSIETVGNVAAEKPVPEERCTSAYAFAIEKDVQTVPVVEDVADQENIPCNITPVEQKAAIAKVKSKKRFCALCGNKIDPDTKKCTGCGKQYFKFNKSVAIILMLVTALASVSTLSVCQFENNQKLQLQIDALKSELKDAQAQKDSQTLDTKIVISHIRVIIGNQIHKIDCPNVNPDMRYRIIGIEGRVQAILSGYKSCPVCN